MIAKESSINKEATMDEIVEFIVQPPSQLEQKTEARAHHHNRGDRFLVLRPIKEIDKLNGYKMNKLGESTRGEIPLGIRPESCKEDYNCAEYKVWMFNHFQTKSFWEDIKDAGLFD